MKNIYNAKGKPNPQSPGDKGHQAKNHAGEPDAMYATNNSRCVTNFLKGKEITVFSHVMRFLSPIARRLWERGEATGDSGLSGYRDEEGYVCVEAPLSSFGIAHNHYDRLRKILVTLSDITLDSSRMFDCVFYPNYVRLRFDEKILHLLLDADKGYTSVPAALIDMLSPWMLKLYVALKSWVRKGWQDFDTDKLMRELFPEHVAMRKWLFVERKLQAAAACFRELYDAQDSPMDFYFSYQCNGETVTFWFPEVRDSCSREGTHDVLSPRKTLIGNLLAVDLDQPEEVCSRFEELANEGNELWIIQNLQTIKDKVMSGQVKMPGCYIGKSVANLLRRLENGKIPKVPKVTKMGPKNYYFEENESQKLPNGSQKLLNGSQKLLPTVPKITFCTPQDDDNQ